MAPESEEQRGEFIDPSLVPISSIPISSTHTRDGSMGEFLCVFFGLSGLKLVSRR